MESTGVIWVRTAIVSVILSLAGGCGMLGMGKSPQKPVHDYVLSAGFAAGAERAGGAVEASCISAQVVLPRSAAGFNTSRMAYMREPDRVEYFAYNQWVDTPAYMIQPLLVRALEQSGRFAHVVRAPAQVGRRFRLEGDDLALVQKFDGGVNTVRLALRVRMADARKRSFIFDEALSFEQTASSADPKAGVAAANQLARSLVDAVANLARERVDPSAYCGEPDEDY